MKISFSTLLEFSFHQRELFLKNATSDVIRTLVSVLVSVMTVTKLIALYRVDQLLTFCIRCQIVWKGGVSDNVLNLLIEACSYLRLEDRNKQSAECSRTLPVVRSGKVAIQGFVVPRENFNL